MPLSHLIVLEAWETYVSESDSVLSVEAFTRWVIEKLPDTLFVISEPALTSIAQEIARGRLADVHGVSRALP